MGDIIKSIRVGTVNFFGIVIPGFLAVFILIIGFILPIFSIIEDSKNRNPIPEISGFTMTDSGTTTVQVVYPNNSDANTGLKLLSSGSPTVDIAVVLLVSYVLGYILRLSSPDDLDRISAENVFNEEHHRYFRKFIYDANKEYWEEKMVACFEKLLKENPNELSKLISLLSIEEQEKDHENNNKEFLVKSALDKYQDWLSIKVTKRYKINKLETRRKTSEFILRKLIIRKYPIWVLKIFFRRIYRNCGNLNKKCNDLITKDCWPYNPMDCSDKYPYFQFRYYLQERGHADLIKSIVTWGSDTQHYDGDGWIIENSNGKEEKIKITKRSKSTINKLKMEIRQHCPELIGLLEGKEAHIRLMAGTWTVFQFAHWFVGVSLVALIAELIGLLPFTYKNETIFSFIFICIFFLVGMWLSNKRIEKLFHYRRVSELFHIVQAAFFAEEKFAQRKNK